MGEGVDERARHRVADERDDVHAFPLDEVPDLVGVEAAAGVQDDGVAAEQRDEQRPLRVAVHERGERAADPGRGRDVLRDRGGCVDPGPAVVAAAHRREEDVLGPPHDAFRHPRRAARVEDVEVVGRAGQETVPGRRRGRERVLVVHGVESRSQRSRPVVELEQVAKLGHAGEDGGDVRAELGFENQRDEVGVVEEVAQFLDHVPVVDVDRHDARLEAAEHGLDPFGPVERVDADVLAGDDPDVAQVVRDPVRPLVELPEGEAPVAGDDRGAVGNGVGDDLEQVGEVEFHGADTTDRPRANSEPRGPRLSNVRGVSVWLQEARAYPNGVVATPHYLASAAGAAMLADGGNAIDAAFAANFVLGVVTPYMCGFGGDLLAMVWDGELGAYRGVGRAPAAATADFVRSQSGEAEMPVFGPHPVTVPGAVEAWFTLIERYGTRSFGELAQRALHYAEEGFPLTRRGAWFFQHSVALYAHCGLGDFHDAYGDVAAGDWVRQPELARTIRLLAEEGPDAYYRGPIASAIAERLQRAGGGMTEADIAAHTGAWVEPLRAPVRDAEILEMPPPTQGVTALEALRIVDGLDLGADGPDRQHLLIEAVKLALADRRRYLGDPAAMTVPAERLLADGWIDARRAEIDPARARPAAAHAEPDGGTIYMCAADRDGMLVSLIQSNFSGAGSGLRVGEWGLNLHNRGSAFVLDDEHANGIGPGKMPLHTLIPALALRDGRPWLVFGTEGGHGQAQTHTQLLVRMLVDRDDPQRAISAPRFTIDPANGRIAMEDHFDAAWIDDLRRRGHDIDVVRGYRHGPGIAHAIECTGPGYRAGSDPRAEGGTVGL